jgi:LPS-assembly protein
LHPSELRREDNKLGPAHMRNVALSGAIACTLLGALAASPSAQARDEFANCGPGLLVPARPEFDGDLTEKVIQITADDADLSEEGISLLRGNVQYNNGDLRLAGERMRYDQPNELLKGRGNVQLWDKDLYIEANEAELNTLTGAWDVQTGNYIRAGEHAHGSAQRMTVSAEDIIRVQEGTYTTCNPDDNAWVFEANHIELNQLTNVGTARDVKVLVKGVPVFYSPWLSFPLSSDRKSGLLAPAFGVTTSAGVEATIPYYFNIAPNLDATVAARAMSNRGLMGYGEFRYLTDDSIGGIQGELLPYDIVDAEPRGQVSFQHLHQISPYWQGEIDYNWVSDREYFADFGNSLAASSVRYLTQVADIRYSYDGWYFLGRLHQFQTVDNTIPTSSRPYRRLPQLRLSYASVERNRALNYGGFAESVYFDNSSRVNGLRLDNEAYVSYPMRTAGTFIIPKVKLRYTHYELDNTGGTIADSRDRLLPTFSLDSGALFERSANLFGNAYTHTLEPRIFYKYTTFDDQRDIPIFDTGQFTFNFAQLFRDTPFSGADRVDDAHRVSLAVSSRLLEQNSGDEIARVSVGQIVHLRDRRVQLPGVSVQDESTSDFVAEVATNIADSWFLKAGAIWDPHEGSTERATVGLRYQPSADKVLNVSYRFLRGTTSETADVSARWPIMEDVGLVGRWNYALAEEQTLEAFGGVEFDTCCWTFRAVARRHLADTTGELNNTVFLQVELKGLAGVGRKTERLLERQIPGYQNPF